MQEQSGITREHFGNMVRLRSEHAAVRTDQGGDVGDKDGGGFWGGVSPAKRKARGAKRGNLSLGSFLWVTDHENDADLTTLLWAAGAYLLTFTPALFVIRRRLPKDVFEKRQPMG
jgi:hypothetical protein